MMMVSQDYIYTDWYLPLCFSAFVVLVYYDLDFIIAALLSHFVRFRARYHVVKNKINENSILGDLLSAS
jgi:hypothetical protein